VKRDANEDIHDFLVDCARGEALVEGEPAYAWRDWVASLPVRRNVNITARIGYALLYAWDKFRTRKSITKLRAPGSCPDIEPLAATQPEMAAKA
jgi:hypothetical protein